jgi:hypothetical protein
MSRTSLLFVLSFLLTDARSALQHTLALKDVEDAVIGSEIAQLGGYAELARPMGQAELHIVPLRSWSTTHLEFAADDLRGRIDMFPFTQERWIGGDPGHRLLEGWPVLGWDASASHARITRVELVIDGAVLAPPTDMVTDVFDPQPCGSFEGRVIPYALMARSADGWRTYIQVLAGSGADAALVTWVFEDGAYLFRVVDAFSPNG